MSTDIDLKGVLDALSEFGSTFDKANDDDRSQAPEITKTVGDDVQSMPMLKKALSPEDRVYMQRKLSALNPEELTVLFHKQLGRDGGIPIQQAWDYQTAQRVGEDPVISKVLDTSTTVLQRQDLEPILYTLFVKFFPAFERFRKMPSNGVVHTWNQITAYGDAQFMSELGTVVDDTATYARQTTNIAQLGTRRGVTFKEQLAVPAGGMPWNPGQIEIQQGLYAMAHKLQKTIFQGQASNTGGSSGNELGAYDANAFTGLRATLDTNNAGYFSPYLSSNAESFVTAVNSAIVPITDNYGVPPTTIYARAGEVAQFSNQERTLQRYVDRTEITPGVIVPSIATAVGILPIISVPGDSIGTYSTNFLSLPTATVPSGKTVADVYILNEGTIGLPYLGSPGPTVLEIPPGVSGQLTRLYIIWCLMGLAVEVIPANNKTRANTATS